MNNIRSVWVAGFIASAVYLIGATIAYFTYPFAYSPFTNWLSDLGNPINNPSGALSYNLGCILSGLGLIGFSLGLQTWDDGEKRHKILLVIAQVTNIVSALSLIVAALFPLGAHTPVHAIAGKLHIVFAGFFLTFSATVLLRRLQTPKWIGYFGFFSALVNFVYGAFLHEVFIIEWAAIGMFIVYILLISNNALQHDALRIGAGVR